MRLLVQHLLTCLTRRAVNGAQTLLFLVRVSVLLLSQVGLLLECWPMPSPVLESMDLYFPKLAMLVGATNFQPKLHMPCLAGGNSSISRRHVVVNVCRITSCQLLR